MTDDNWIHEDATLTIGDGDEKIPITDVSLSADSVDYTPRDLQTDYSWSLDLENDIAQAFIQSFAEAFTDYVISKAETRVQVPTFDTDAIIEAVYTLEQEGFAIGDHDHQARGVGVTTSDLADDLRDAVDDHVRCDDGTDEVNAPTSIGVYGVDVYPDASVPEGHAIIIHPHAAAPTPPGHSRPWVVRYPKGICVVEVRDD